jgi:hypothetical protein
MKTYCFPFAAVLAATLVWLSADTSFAQRTQCILPPDSVSAIPVFPPNSPEPNAVQEDGYVLGTGKQLQRVGRQSTIGNYADISHESLLSVVRRTPGGVPGGEIVEMSGEMIIHLQRGNIETTCTVETVICHFAMPPRPDAGAPLETIEAELVRFEAEVTDNPNFSLVRVTGGTLHGYAGTGKVTLTLLPSGNFSCDSFFDITYRLDVQGTGPEWGGLQVSDNVRGRLSHTDRAIGGMHYDTTGAAVVGQIEEGLLVSNLGSSGLDSVRISQYPSPTWIRDWQWGHAGAISPPAGTGTGLSIDGLSLGTAGASFVCSWGEPCLGTIEECLGISLRLSNTSGGAIACEAFWGQVNAPATLVEVWDGDTLAGSRVVAVGSVACVFPGGGFVSGGGDDLYLRKRPGRTKYGDITLKRGLGGPAEVQFGDGSIVSGTRIVCSPVDAVGDPPSSLGMTLRGPNSHYVCRPLTFVFDHLLETSGALAGSKKGDEYKLQAGPIYVLSPPSAQISGGPDEDCDGETETNFLPVSVEMEPLAIECCQGRLTGVRMHMRSMNGEGTVNSEATIRETSVAGGSGSGTVSVDFSGNGASTCRVGVMDGANFVGSFTVAVNGETDVCVIGDSSARVNGCGKRKGLWPWENSCLVQDFDRLVPFSPPGGGTPLTGNRLLLLATDPTPGVLEETTTLELSTGGSQALTITNISSAATPHTQTVRGKPVFGESVAMSRIAQSEASVIDIDASTALSYRGELTGMSLVSSNGGRHTYSATLLLHLSGLGSLDYSSTVELPGTVTFAPGQNLFPDEEVQQFPVEVLDFSFQLPQGHPDFLQLSVHRVSNNGPSTGRICVRAVEDENFNIDSFFDIWTEVSLQGNPTGGIGDIGGSKTHQDEWETPRPSSPPVGGIRGFPEGNASLTAQNNILTVDNIGSSGIDGVRFPLPTVEGFTIASDDFCPRLTTAETGSFSFEEFGKYGDQPHGSSLGVCRITQSVDSFFDIFLDFTSVSPTQTTIAVYEAGTLVASFPQNGPDPRQFTCHPAGAAGAALPPVTEIGKLPGLGRTPCKRVRWGGILNIRVPGQAPVNGDEVRLLAHGVEFETVSSVVCLWRDCSGTDITEFWTNVFGREITGQNQALFQSSRGRNDAEFEVYNRLTGERSVDICDDIDDDCNATIIVRAPAGETDTWPVFFAGERIRFPSVGSGCVLEARGAIGGVLDQSYGTLIITQANAGLRLTGDFSSRGTDTLRLIVYDDRVDRVRPVCSSLVSPSLIADLEPGHETVLKACGAVPELIDPNQIECFYQLSFDGPVNVTTPGGEACVGTRIEVQLVNPTAHSETLASLSAKFTGFRGLKLTAISNGPHRRTGLRQWTVGSARLEPLGQTGAMRLTGLGDSRSDGVCIDLTEAEGAVQTSEPVDIIGSSADLLITYFSKKGYDYYKSQSDMSAGRVTMHTQKSCDGTTPVTREYLLLGVSGDEVTGSITVSGTGPVDMCGIGESAFGITGRLVRYGRVPFAIRRHNYLRDPFLFVFDAPVLCTPSDGSAAFEATELLLVCCGVDEDCDLIAPDNRDNDCDDILCDDTLTARFGKLPEVVITSTEFRHFRDTACLGKGGAALQVDDGALSVTGIGSSGADGVGFSSRTSALAVFVFEPNEIAASSLRQMTLRASHSRGDAGALVLGPLTGQQMPFSADFAALGTSQARVVVMSGGSIAGSFVADSAFLGTIDSATPYLYKSCGKLRGFPIPGGHQPPCFFMETENPFSVSPPGGGNPITGTELRVLAEGATVSIGDITGFDILAASDNGNGEFVVTEVPRRDLNSWLMSHYTPEELTAICDGLDNDCDGILLTDGDGDSLTLLEEYGLNRNPRLQDFKQRPLSTWTPDGFVYRYEVDPYAQVEIQLRQSPDLLSWNNTAENPETQLTLEDVSETPDGNLLYTWRIRQITKPKNQFHGHVTILK